jgi:crotonobetainyl-CoA:carnitine CoA-transferase CaiB-like acyl-CoA transferase
MSADERHEDTGNSAAATLTSRIRATLSNPANVDGDFDIHAELDDILKPIGLSAGDCGGKVTFEGRDPIVPSVLRLGAAAGLGLVAKSVAIAKLWRMRGGESQDIDMDLRVAPHRLCPFYDRKWEKINGFTPASPNDPDSAFGMTFYKTADSRFVLPLNPYPIIKKRAQRLLRAYDDRGAVAEAVAAWRGLDLEQAAAEAGVVMGFVRSPEEFLVEPQYRALAGAPLIEIEKIGESDPMQLPRGVSAPLQGVRALGMGHVIAGGGIGRALALHGADVLNLWRPTEIEIDQIFYTAQVGARSATVDPRSADGALKIRTLLSDADIFYANRTPGYLESIGLSPQETAAIRPGVIHVTLSLNGVRGPWMNRIGFDQVAGCITGLMALEGGMDQPSLPPIMVVNDYIVGWLCAAGAIEALMRRAVDGGSYRVHVSLTRTALWLLSLGIFNKDYAHGVAGSGGEHSYFDPELFTADTPLGHYQGVTDQVRMSETPGAYRYPLTPRGAGRAEWIEG